MAFRYLDGDYAITAMYSVPDDAWYLELDLVAGQRALVTAIVPDDDPAQEPTVCFNPNAGHTDVPYEVMRWFMHQVDEEISTSRAWMRLRPELVRSTWVPPTMTTFPRYWRTCAPRSPRKTSPTL